MKILAVIKSISVKLQKKSNDIVKAYNMISETEKELKELRDKNDVLKFTRQPGGQSDIV